MPDTQAYPAEIERNEDGRYVVTFPDFGWGATDGATRDEALEEAKDLLRELIATTIREGKDLPKPSRNGKNRPRVVPPAQIASKATHYGVKLRTGLSPTVERMFGALVDASGEADDDNAAGSEGKRAPRRA